MNRDYRGSGRTTRERVGYDRDDRARCSGNALDLAR